MDNCAETVPLRITNLGHKITSARFRAWRLKQPFANHWLAQRIESNLRTYEMHGQPEIMRRLIIEDLNALPTWQQ